MAHWHDFNPWADKLIYLPDFQEVYENIAGWAAAENLRRTVEDMKKYDIYLLADPKQIHPWYTLR